MSTDFGNEFVPSLVGLLKPLQNLLYTARRVKGVVASLLRYDIAVCLYVGDVPNVVENFTSTSALYEHLYEGRQNILPPEL